MCYRAIGVPFWRQAFIICVRKILYSDVGREGDAQIHPFISFKPSDPPDMCYAHVKATESQCPEWRAFSQFLESLRRAKHQACYLSFSTPEHGPLSSTSFSIACSHALGHGHKAAPGPNI